MFRIPAVIALLILCCFPSFAQTPTKLAGFVKDGTGKGLPDANIIVLKASDSSFVKADLTENDGRYEITIVTGGNYLLTGNATGYKQQFSAPVSVAEGSTAHVPDMVLNKIDVKLKEVTVTSKKQMIEVKADKVVFNVENSINATGNNALELLQKSPGVVIDNNENISLKGKNGVKVFIDGRLTQLDSKELAAYLKGINSSDIEAIEMISNPSAKYDASGNAGIINFKLKKNKKFGTNGSASATFIQGFTPKANGSVNLNYRNKKVNVFGNVGGGLGRRLSGINLDRIQRDTNYVQRSITNHDDTNVNLKAGLDYFMSAKQTLGFLVTTNLGNNYAAGESYTRIYSKDGSFVKKLNAFNNVPASRTNNNVNFNYKFADTSGHELNIDGDYGLFRGRNTIFQPNYYLTENDNLINAVVTKNYTPTNIDIYTLKADWEQKLGKATLGIGGKVSYVVTDNTLDFYDVISTQETKDLAKSNSFKYTENVNAAYVNYNRTFSEAVSLQAGLRMENTSSSGELSRADGVNQDNDTVRRSYTNLFPSGALSWNVNKNHGLNLTFSRRIDRPSYQDLNPFEYKLDELTYRKGNAFLRPQFTNSIEFTHVFKSALNTTIGYSHVNDLSTKVTDTVGGNRSFVQERNLATQRVLSFNIGSGLPIKKWWNGYANIWFNYVFFDGVIGANKVSTQLPMYGAYVQQSVTLGKGYSAEVSGWYNGPGAWGVTWRTKQMGAVDAGIQRQFWDKSATLKVAVSDIFFTGYWRSVNDFGGLYVVGNGRGENRLLKISFSYRFGSSQVAAARKRETGLESEKSRIK